MKTFVLLSMLLVVANVGAMVESHPEKNEQELKINRAVLDLKVLDNVIAVYHVKYGSYPETLTQLTKAQANGISAQITEAALVDPWGRPYRYDPNTTHPKTGKPLIFTHGPDPGEPKGKITNWDSFDKKK